MTIVQGPLLVEGKTKKIFTIENDPHSVIVEYKNTITAFDDPAYTKEFDTKAQYSNTTTCRVFEHLQNAGIPVAYKEQYSDTAFISPTCEMIPLEVVARRYAVGSYLKRHPEFTKPDNETPYRFEEPFVEFFLKTTQGAVVVNGKTILEGLDPKKGEEDPLIAEPYSDAWELLHPKKEAAGAALNKSIVAKDVLPDGIKMEDIQTLAKNTCLALESLWAKHNFHLIDFKIECGVDKEGNLLVADVIDNDSWRLRDESWQDLSKQSFRDGEDLSTIENKYALVAQLLNKIM
jgi:phosphoribosylaminoimidazole carboxylase/phosphoribosylaminoimidazole-succinocarboxamide synthase